MSTDPLALKPAFTAELLELLDEGVILHGMDGGAIGCNTAAERILGISSLQAAGRRGLLCSLEAVGENGALLTPDAEPAREALRTGAPCGPRRIRIRRPEGEAAWLQVKAIPLLEPRGADASGCAIANAMTVVQDLSEQVLVEQRLRGLLPEDAFSRLAGSVAHDFNHFLTVIMGYNDVILQSLRPGDPLREHADYVRDAAKSATALTRELLDFSRRHRRVAGAVDLKFTITSMQPMLARLLGSRISLRLDLDRASVWVRANAAQLERVILNLAFNARDAMSAGGELRLATRPVVIDEAFVGTHPGAQAGSFVRLTVTDNGAGMEAGTRRRLFEPFFTTKPQGQGTGLGLSTVWGIVKQFGGYIEVESEPGKGTEFRIDLPAHPDAARFAGGECSREEAVREQG